MSIERLRWVRNTAFAGQYVLMAGANEIGQARRVENGCWVCWVRDVVSIDGDPRAVIAYREYGTRRECRDAILAGGLRTERLALHAG